MQDLLIRVKNAEGDPDTTARLIIQNSIDYIPKVSVIIPVYNTEKYLCDCLDSLVGQTLKEIEIICVDDGSTDCSLNILKEYAAKDKRITILAQENLHAGVARNAGIAVAKGEYLCFLDADDFFEINFFNECYKVIKEEKSDLLVFLYTLYDNYTHQKLDTKGINKKFTKEITTLDMQSIRDEAFTICNPMPWNKFISHNIIYKNKIRFQNLSASNDIYFSLCLMASVNNVTFYEKSFVYYRFNRVESLRNSRDKYPFTFYNAYKRVYSFLSDKKLDYFKKTFFDSFISSCFWTIDNTVTQRRNVKKFISDTIIPEFSILKENINFISKNNIDKLNMLTSNDIIISLTSFPGRINTVHIAIESLLNQSFKADKLILWLAQSQFPNKEADLPATLLSLCPKGLSIEWCEDIRSYKKLIPALKAYPDDIIVTADDDLIYPNDWLCRLIHAYVKQPDMLHCLRAHNIGIQRNKILPYKRWKKEINHSIPCFCNLFTGGGGAVYTKKLLHKDILREDIFTRLCPDADDIWFWGMTVLQKTKINVVTPTLNSLNYVHGSQDGDLPLWKKNVLQDENDYKIKAFLDAYPSVKRSVILDHKMLPIKKFMNRISKPYYKEKDGKNKTIYLFGIPVFKKKKTESIKHIYVLGLPVYSKKKHDFRTTTRILFFHYTHKNWGKFYNDLRQEIINLDKERSEKHLKNTDNILKKLDKIGGGD